MELLIWHEALGSDDEQATEEELQARLLYAHIEGDGGNGRSAQTAQPGSSWTMASLQFMQALVTFTRMIRRQQHQTEAHASSKGANWISVALSKRRFFIREVEPQIYMALGTQTAEICGSDTRVVHQAALHHIYEMFRVFHGRLDHQLRQLPLPTVQITGTFHDGMELLHHIASLRKRLRKCGIEMELQDHEKLQPPDRAADNTQSRLKKEVAKIQEELAILDPILPNLLLRKRCESFFPTLLHVMEVSRLNAFHDAQGVSYSHIDEPTFLSLQSRINSFRSELQDMFQGDGDIAVFFKGNLLWQTFHDQTTFHRVLQFLQFREQDGIDIIMATTSTTTQPDTSVSVSSDDSLWMQVKYDDAFSPVWASKTTYAEWAVVNHIAPQPRRGGARTLHKQSSSSLAELAASAASATAAATMMSSDGSAPSKVAIAEQILIRRGQRYRSDAPVYRNRGFLTHSGYFLPGWELAKSNSQETAWAPSVFAPTSNSEAATGAARSRALVWHERDVTILVLVKQTPEPAAIFRQMERMEDCLEKLHVASLFTGGTTAHATTSNREHGSREMSSSSSSSPYVFLNRLTGAFQANQIPRLIKTKEEDLFPRPAAMLAHYFPPMALQLMNDSHAALHSDPESREVRVKTVHDGWLIARRSAACHRELYAFFDTKIASISDAEDPQFAKPKPMSTVSIVHHLSSSVSDTNSPLSPLGPLPFVQSPATKQPVTMGKIIDSILTAYGDAESSRPTISFEFFPAKTDDGVFNLLNRVEEMGFSLRPTFVTLTWRSAFKDEKLWLRIGAHIQKEFQLDVLLHLTCHLPREEIKDVLRNARAAGIRNILALRGDPPIGADRWKPIVNGLNNAVDLIRLIREEHGDFFCIACAGYPEVHTESWNHPDLPPSNQSRVLDLERLKLKQDAGADFIITQFFFDTDNLLQWVKDCREYGIHIPILPGYLPIQNYNSFLKFTSWCKTKVPREVVLALEKIKNDDAAVKKYGTELAIQTCKRIQDAGIKSLHFYTMNLASTVTQVLEGLDLIPTRNQRDLPWQSTLRRTNSNGKETEQVRPIFWSNRQASYIARTSEWDDFPNGRWGDRTSPAYGDLSEYYLAFKRPKVNRKQLWGVPQSHEDVWNVFAKFIDGTVKQLPWCEQTLSSESLVIKENLKWVNAHGFLTINSQPRVNGAPSSDPSVGWGAENGFVFQKAYLEFFVSPRLLEKLLDEIQQYPQLSFHAMNLAGKEHTNTPPHSVTAVTWGVFPGQEIVQPTVVDSDSFAAWKNEAFELWQTQWASAYDPQSPSFQVIQDIYNSYFLVNIVDNEYTSEESDIFSIFTRIITQDMDKGDLRDRVLELETKNEKLHETIAKFQSIQDEMSKELVDVHAQLSGSRDENQILKMQLRQLQAQIALSTL